MGPTGADAGNNINDSTNNNLPMVLPNTPGVVSVLVFLVLVVAMLAVLVILDDYIILTIVFQLIVKRCMKHSTIESTM
eukprot:1363963-Amphidinium_carterae.1